MTLSEFIKPIKSGLIVCAFLFYILPFVYRLMPDEDSYNNCMYIVLQYINSTCVVLTSIVLVCKENFRWYFPLTIAALFGPTLLMFYNSYPEVATMYMLGYVFFSYIAWPSGLIIRKIIDRNNRPL